MGKQLKVEYNGSVLYDSEVDELSWTESDGAISVKGSVKPAGRNGNNSSPGGGLMGLLSGMAARQQALAPEQSPVENTPVENTEQMEVQ